jgi:hypothetical protein
MMKTTYVPNTIEIPTHEVNLKHQRVGFEKRSKNHKWMKKKKEGDEVFRELSHTSLYSGN